MNLKQWFSFEGIITRKQYWLSLLVIFTATILLEFLGFVGFVYLTHTDSHSQHHLLLIYSFLFAAIIFLGLIISITWIEFALVSKRCRDIGINPFWSLLLLIPYVNLIAIIVIGSRKSKSL